MTMKRIPTVDKVGAISCQPLSCILLTAVRMDVCDIIKYWNSCCPGILWLNTWLRTWNGKLDWTGCLPQTLYFSPRHSVGAQ